MIKVGQLAPDFTLTGYVNGEFKDYTLSEVTQSGKWAVIFFYPADFTFVCPTEIKGFNKKYADFQKADAEVMGVSVDSHHSHRAWVEHELGTLEFPLLSDFQKRVSQDYNVLMQDPEDGQVAMRGTFIVDPQGVLRYTVVSDKNVGRSVDETLRVVKALQTGGMCPVDWEDGEQTLDA